MIKAILLGLYIIFGAIIGGIYYYLQLKRDEYEDDVFVPIMVGLGWPIVAPFAFAFYYARKLSERTGKK